LQHHRDPNWAVAYAEHQAERLIARERKINEVIERRNPHLKPTAQFLAGPRRESSFYTREQFLSYLWRFTMSKYDSNVRP
jgi:hypothetical protein